MFDLAIDGASIHRTFLCFTHCTLSFLSLTANVCRVKAVHEFQLNISLNGTPARVHVTEVDDNPSEVRLAEFWE